MTWQTKRFEQLSRLDLNDIFSLRQNVFIIEQSCIYADIDGLDQAAVHILKRHSQGGSNKPLSAYARILPPGVKHTDWAIGRVIVSKAHRHQGLGSALMFKAIAHIRQTQANAVIRISAQQHLKGFYNQLDFECVSKPYDEDGIPHIEMRNKPPITQS